MVRMVKLTVWPRQLTDSQRRVLEDVLREGIVIARAGADIEAGQSVSWNLATGEVEPVERVMSMPPAPAPDRLDG